MGQLPPAAFSKPLSFLCSSLELCGSGSGIWGWFGHPPGLGPPVQGPTGAGGGWGQFRTLVWGVSRSCGSAARRSCSDQSQWCRASVLPCPLGLLLCPLGLLLCPPGLLPCPPGLLTGEHWSHSCRSETRGFREQQPPLVSRGTKTSSAVLTLPWEFPQAALAMAQVAEDDLLEQQTPFPRGMHQLVHSSLRLAQTRAHRVNSGCSADASSELEAGGGVGDAGWCSGNRSHQPGRSGWTGTASSMTSELCSVSRARVSGQSVCQPLAAPWERQSFLSRPREWQ